VNSQSLQGQGCHSVYLSIFPHTRTCKGKNKNTVIRMAILGPIYIVNIISPTSDRLKIHGLLRPTVAVHCKGFIVWSIDQGSYKSLLVRGLWIEGGQVVFVPIVEDLGKNMFG
jgi:hypothetical protein